MRVPPNIHSQNRVMCLEYLGGREVHGPDQAGFIRIMTNGGNVHLDLVGLEDHRGAPDGKFADPASTKAAPILHHRFVEASGLGGFPLIGESRQARP
jgi:hypothetical protein